jgi:16S rRNA G1207 methylase RsmC
MASDQLWNANIQYHSLLVEAIPHGARHVVDVACGDGILSAQLARAYRRRIPCVLASLPARRGAAGPRKGQKSTLSN